MKDAFAAPPPGGRSIWQHAARPFAAFGRYTAAAFGWRQVRAGARSIRLLWDAVRERRPEPQPRAGPIPLDCAVRAVRAGLWQTAWAARVYTAAGGLLLGFWAAEALVSQRWASPLTAVLVVLVAVALWLKAFLEALRNWQLRTARMGTAAEFLAWEDGPLWPPLPQRPR